MGAAPSMDQLKQGMRATWMAGDFGVVAKTIAGSAEALVQRMTLPAGTQVLDIATGTGNVALPLARAGCVVTGVDIAPNLLVQARERAAAEGLQITFNEGDAEALPYADGSFDAVATMFGAMFAPRPEMVAAEMFRVLRPGGTLTMANWNPESFTGKMFRTGAAHVPPPPGVQPPVLWGDAATANERLSAAGFVDIQSELIPVDFDMPVPPAGAVDFFRRYFGPTKTAFERLDDGGKAAMEKDLVDLWSGENVADDPATRTLVKNQYRQVTARKP